MKRTAVCWLLSLWLMIFTLSGCTCSFQRESSQSGSPSSAIEESPPPVSSSRKDSVSEPNGPQSPADEEEKPAEGIHPYLASLIAPIVEEISAPGMSDYEKTRAAFDYMITHVSMEEPIGLELWRIHGGGDTPIPFVEQRAISPLRFGVGMCEDYAAALTLLLRGMGLSAEYVPGLTFSAEGHLVDHAWTMVEIDGSWYHLDSQLEDNISRHGAVRYKYFLRGDASLSGSHRWGQNLIDSRLLSEKQNEEIRESFPAPAAPGDYPTPQRLELEETPAPDLNALRAEAATELADWEAENGPLPEMELNIIPPVFGLEGYGPADEG
ncbi:MAG: transglutaminase domain-containing protein [Provencibacterium sp.]|nr:transglutaminase domain-containing protein [Provencibacterium sp.]